LSFFLSAGLIVFYAKFQQLQLNYFYLTAFIIAILLVVPVFSWFGIYQPLRVQSLFKHLSRLCLAVLCVMLLLATIGFATKTSINFSRVWFFSWFILTLILLALFRVVLLVLLRTMRKHGWNQRQVLIVGAGAMAAKLISEVQSALWSGLNITAILDNNSQDLTAYIREHKVDEVWLTLPFKEEQSAADLVQALADTMVTIRYFPDMLTFNARHYFPTEVFGLTAINLVFSPMLGINRFIKAIEDRIFALLFLVLLSPLFLIIALLVKLSSKGPVFYQQERMSWNGKKFTMLKFRTMPLNVEETTGAVWSQAKEIRATKIGALLRKTSLDELPQFINVLCGDMSIVGPRPERPIFVKEFKQQIPHYMQKHQVKAGITGWAQINGWRGNSSLEKRIESDLFYIENWSLWFDIKIMALTLVKGMVNKR
ncbi:MAG: undecaprenyl-phosphate glucose phosphotransferase, partial [Gammaproteobacteria bacterium]|nr:undecaprenyl-phosphate glucose phosphotransferase [Gammaproteobacteria bacterium]